MKKPYHCMLGASVFLIYFLFISFAEGWNVETRWALAKAIARQGTTRIDDYTEESHDVITVNGHMYSAKAPGIGLACVPLVWIMDRVSPPSSEVRAEAAKRYLARLVTVSVPAAILVTMLSIKASPLVAVACGLGTPILPYATLLYGHVTATLFVFLSFLMMRGSQARPRLSGLLGGLAVLVEYSAAVAVLGIFLLGFLGNRRRWVSFIMGALPVGALFALYNVVSFGTPIATGYSGFENPEFQEVVNVGVGGFGFPSLRVLWDSLFGSYRGLLRYAPWLMLWPVGMLYLEVSRMERAISGAIPLLHFLLFSGFVMWWGGASCCMRHYIVVLPFMALSVSKLRGAWLGVLGILGVLATAVHLLFTVVEPEVPENFAVPLFDMAIPWLLQGRARPTVMPFVEDGTLWGALFAVLVAVAAWSLAWWMQCHHNAQPTRDQTA
jgi:hypothetical protein